MATTENLYVGDGSTVLFSFTFPYLETTDIKVSLDGVDTTAYSLANATTVQFNTAPTSGSAIRIYRQTDDAALSATFYPGSAIRSQDLNENFTQNLYVTQEANNYGLKTDGSNKMLGDLDLNGNKIVNLATPTASADASTKGYVDGLISTGAANAAAAAASASAAAGSATAAANSLDSFDDRYLGAKTTDPTVDNDGNALLVGAIYFNSTSKVMRVWNGANWQDSSANANVLRWRKTAVGGETTLSGNDDSGQSLTYTVNLEAVFLNGALLQRGVDYVATTGNSITGLVALTAGDVVEVLAFSQVSLLAIPSNTVTFTQTGTGAVQRTLESKLKDVVSVKDFGAKGDGVTDDTAAVNAAKNAITSQVNGVFLATNGEYPSTGTVWDNNVQPTNMPMTRPGVFGVFEGTAASPEIKDRGPAVWVQKYTKYDSDGDRFNHNAGGIFGEVNVIGSGVAGSNDVEGTWIGILGNAVINGANQGTSAAPDYDAYGSSIGVAGFARLTGYPGDGNIACGVWGYTQGPTMDATTHSNLPATNWSLVGVESNIQINHPDIGEQSVVSGKGSSVGFLAFNYRTPNTGKVDWTFGIALNGNPNDGNFASTDIDNWNGFYCGLLIDKIKSKGIRFGQYMKTGSYGIYFPDSYIGAQEPAAAIYLGNSKINTGQYVGSTFNDNDFWHNGGQLYFQHSGITRRVLTHNQATGVLPSSTKIDFQTNGAFTQFSIGAAANSVNYMKAFGSAAAGAPAMIAEGTDTNIDIELRPKGSGRVWVGAWTANADAAVNGYITVKDSSGVVRKLATIA